MKGRYRSKYLIFERGLITLPVLAEPSRTLFEYVMFHRLRDTLSKEICLVKQALEWGDEGTPPHHWDQLVAVRGSLCDLNHNLRTLISE